MKYFHTKTALFLVLAALAALTPVGTIRADDKNAPAWKKAVPGTHAFLGDDGGGVNVATVCDTADRYRGWLKSESPPGCQTFQHDLPIVIELVIRDATADTFAGAWLPLAKIKIPSTHFTGYTQLLGLHPNIPIGTTIHFVRKGNGRFQLHEAAQITESQGIDLGENASASVIHFDPTQDDKWDLYVSINDGPYAGKKGWMLSFGASTDDGNPIDQFSEAAISNKQLQ